MLSNKSWPATLSHSTIYALPNEFHQSLDGARTRKRRRRILRVGDCVLRELPRGAFYDLTAKNGCNPLMKWSSFIRVRTCTSLSLTGAHLLPAPFYCNTCSLSTLLSSVFAPSPAVPFSPDQDPIWQTGAFSSAKNAAPTKIAKI